MLICQEEWCAGLHRLPDHAQETRTLGLMRFSSRLLRRRFSLMQDGRTTVDGVEEITNRLGDDRRWYRIDLAVPPPRAGGPARRSLNAEGRAAAFPRALESERLAIGDTPAVAALELVLAMQHPASPEPEMGVTRSPILHVQNTSYPLIGSAPEVFRDASCPLGSGWQLRGGATTIV
jgi:hypothetical protein